MIVESKWMVNNVRSPFYTTCSKCGGEAKRISYESIYSEHSDAIYELKGKTDRLKFKDRITSYNVCYTKLLRRR